MAQNPHGANISYIMIDTSNHVLSHRALTRSQSIFPVKDVLIFSDRPELWPGFNIIEIPKMQSLSDYHHTIFYLVREHLKTDFSITLHYDGFVLNPDVFSQLFLNFDYIGASWPHFKHYNVGNSGFCLRSRKLFDHASEFLQDGDLEQPDDVVMARFMRARLEQKYGAKYATEEIADFFSVEEKRVSHKTFGYHGAWYLPLVYRDDLQFLYENLPPQALRKDYKDGTPQIVFERFKQIVLQQDPECVSLFRNYCQKHFPEHSNF